jgi:Tol biopolymer transport system component
VELDDGEPVGSNPTLILNDIAGGGGPEWSPGGPYEDHILFISDSYNDLEVIPATGGETQILHTVAEGHHIWNPVWSPTGDRIAFMDWDGDHYALKIFNVVSKEVTTVVEPFVGNNLDWARTQDKIAYDTSYKVRNKWIYELYTVDINTGNTQYLFNGKRPTWSPEDKLCFEYRGLVVHDFGTGESEEINNWGYNPDWSRGSIAL